MLSQLISRMLLTVLFSSISVVVYAEATVDCSGHPNTYYNETTHRCDCTDGFVYGASGKCVTKADMMCSECTSELNGTQCIMDACKPATRTCGDVDKCPLNKD